MRLRLFRLPLDFSESARRRRALVRLFSGVVCRISRGRVSFKGREMYVRRKSSSPRLARLLCTCMRRIHTTRLCSRERAIFGTRPEGPWNFSFALPPPFFFEVLGVERGCCLFSMNQTYKVIRLSAEYVHRFSINWSKPLLFNVAVARYLNSYYILSKRLL